MNSNSPAVKLYLDLLKGCLTRLLFPDCCMNLELKPSGFFDRATRQSGQDWPSEAETMIGVKRLENLEDCISDILRNDTPGDLVEAGVWRGGASIFMRAILKAHGDCTRTTWVADSFEGLPIPDPVRYPADADDRLSESNAYLGVPLEQVQANFARYGLLDDRVQFLKGWFRDTLPSAPIDRIALLRADGDMYESTTDVLENLYPKVSPGGYVVIDDYGPLANCRAAVDDFRAKYSICEEIRTIDWTGVYWQRSV
jgi:O-methyltransferase